MSKMTLAKEFLYLVDQVRDMEIEVRELRHKIFQLENGTHLAGPAKSGETADLGDPAAS